MNLLLSDEADEYILLLINAVPISKFDEFIKAIDKKKGWFEELCCCYFETINGNEEYYRFETFEGDTYKLSYEKFLDYVRLSIIRYYLGVECNEIKESLREKIKGTVFESALDNVDASLSIDSPLIG